MRRRFGLLALTPSMLALALVGAHPAHAGEGGSTVACTQSATTTTTTPAGVEGPPTSPPTGPSPGSPCWVDVNPYPFGSEGGPVETPAQPCSLVFNGVAPPGSQCALTVTSMAFRAWNRGLAATDTSEGPGADANNPYGVWLFNGASWFPSPGFPGYSVCPGHTVVWAGKLDYWLIGGPSDLSWSRLCRFDGAALEWESLELPAATKKRVTSGTGSEERRRPGGITSAACLAWNDCWFFGTYGAVVHWDGTQLSDASPDPSLKWLQGEYTAAVARQDPPGGPFGVAVGATAEFHNAASMSEVLPEHEGSPPPEMQVSSGGAFAPVPFTPPTNPQAGDPYRTDLVAVDLDAAGQGWVAGDPPGTRVGFSGHEFPPASPPLAPLSPLVPVSTSGASTTCTGPPRDRFTFTPPAFNAVEPPNSFLWSSIAVIPGSGEAVAGGSLRPHREGTTTGDPNAEPANEPVIAQAACDGNTTVTRFRVEDPTYKGSPPSPLVSADRGGYVSAAAANAINDAWVATSTGSVFDEVAGKPVPQPPHLYRLTDGFKPDAPEGDDLEERPLELHLDPPILVLEPPPPPPPSPPPATVTRTHRVKLPPAIYGVKASLHGKHSLSLYLSFRIRRPVTIGAQALRRGQIVSEARPRRFTGRRGLLILRLDRRRWPTKVRFVA
jgi:hypothetical protein